MSAEKAKSIASATEVAQTFIVPLGQVVADSKKNCRVELEGSDETKGGQTIERLAEDIKKNGQLTPIVVRPLSDDRYEIVDGFRRFAALQQIEKSHVRIQVMNLDDEQAAVLNAKLNLVRKDLSPYEVAMICHRFESTYGWAGDKIAKVLGFTGRTYVNNLCRIVNSVHPKILEQWRKGNGLCTVNKLNEWAKMGKAGSLEAFEAEFKGKDEPLSAKKKKNGHGDKIKKPRAEIIEQAINFFVAGEDKFGDWGEGVVDALTFALGLGDGTLGEFNPEELKKAKAEERKLKKMKDKEEKKMVKEIQEG